MQLHILIRIFLSCYTYNLKDSAIMIVLKRKLHLLDATILSSHVQWDGWCLTTPLHPGRGSQALGDETGYAFTFAAY